MKKLLLILPILILLILQGCSSMGFDGPPSDEEIQKAHWRGWINSLPEEPNKLIESVNSINCIYNESYIVKEPGEFFFQKDKMYISPSVFLQLFDTVGELNITKTFEIKGENILYLGVEIELLKTGKVAKVE